ncbi:MAG: hypothetical protein IJ155_04315 [Prevotella sp.]|nr:hypothetical protein [Prevotella sp.]
MEISKTTAKEIVALLSIGAKLLMEDVPLRQSGRLYVENKARMMHIMVRKLNKKLQTINSQQHDKE